jgi:predicted neuraminidase
MSHTRFPPRFATALLIGVGAVMNVGGCPNWSDLLLGTTTLTFNVDGPATAVATVGDPIFRSAPIFDAIDGRTGSHAPTIVSFADGALLAAWYSYAGPEELDGAAIYTSRRAAGETTWSAPQLHIDRDEADGNPVLYAEGDATWLFQAVVSPIGWSSSRIESQRSTDRGESWTDPTPILGPVGSNVRHPPLRTASGTLLLPAYDDLLQRSIFFASLDDGVTWSVRSDITTAWPNQNSQPSVAAFADGRLLAVMRNTAGGWLWVTASGNEGHSWLTPVDSGFPNPGSPAVLHRLDSGHLLLVYNRSDDSRDRLAVDLSADDGATWIGPRDLIRGGGAYAYPAVTQTADGTIHIVYSHNRETIQHIETNEAWIVGGDGP